MIHLNEGHPALAPLELAAAARRARRLRSRTRSTVVRERVVFTTHTPVPAGQRDVRAGRVPGCLRRSRLPARASTTSEFLGLSRVDPGHHDEPPGMTPLAIRMSRRRNGVSRLHGEVARAMWQPMFPGTRPADVPITHVTNGVHVPTFVGDPMRELLDAPTSATPGSSGPATPRCGRGCATIPNEELWAARCAARRRARRLHPRAQPAGPPAARGADRLRARDRDRPRLRTR